VDLTEHSDIQLRLTGLPDWGIYDYDRLEIDVHRTKANAPGTFYRLFTKKLDMTAGGGNLLLTDTFNDDQLREGDEISVATEGAELFVGAEEPLRARYAASMSSRLILGNIKDYPELDVTFRSVDQLLVADLSNEKITFRKDSSSSSTTTNMTDVIVYDFLTATTVGLVQRTIVPAAAIETTATGFTVTSVAHGLVVGNWVYFYHAGAPAPDNNLTFAGWFQITAKETDTFTVLHGTHGRGTGAAGAVSDVDTFVAAPVKNDVPVWLGVDGNHSEFYENDSAPANLITRRLACAINSSMRNCQTAGFEPWLVANSDGDYGMGQIVIRQPKVLSTLPSVVLTAGTLGTYEVFVNGLKRTFGTSVTASERSFPSRLLVSIYGAEMFDRPFVPGADDSRSAIDINAADGQEITGIIPFFGESVSSGSQKEAMLVVFKEYSIYLVNILTGQYQKIESEGLGCEAPFSIQSIAGGVAFANRAGVYRLMHSQSVEFFGRNLDGQWKNQTNLAYLESSAGHHAPELHKYFLSVPRDAETAPSGVYVYEGEGVEGTGGWTRYTNFPATGWVNLKAQTYFCTTDGEVFKLRNDNLVTDYADDGAPISMTILDKAHSFGRPGERKIVSKLISTYDSQQAFTNTALGISTDMGDLFVETTLTNALRDSQGTGLGDRGNQKAITIRTSPPVRKLVYIQARWQNSGLYEPVILTGVSFVVALRTYKGLKESVDTAE
jgi:hypothetical protein